MADQLDTPNVIISYVAVNGSAQAIVFNMPEDRAVNKVLPAESTTVPANTNEGLARA